VAKSRERNHFISRFLLRRFASKVDAKRNKSWIWDIQKTGVTREISTKDAAVSSKFYGDRATGIEDAFAIEEEKFSAALRAIDAGAPLSEHAATLSRLVWSQAARTRALRHSLAETMDAVFSAFTSSLDSAAATAAFKRMTKEELPRTIADELTKLPPDSRREAERRLEAMGGTEGAVQLALSRIDSLEFAAFGVILNAMMKSEGFIDKAMERGHVKGLSKLLIETPLDQPFKPDAWYLLEDPCASLVLGDVGVFAVAQEGTTSLVMRVSDAWREIYMPISPTKALVGCKGTMRPSLSAQEVNRASASFSLASIYAGRLTESERQLIPLIGTRARFGDASDIQGIVDEVWRGPMKKER